MRWVSCSSLSEEVFDGPSESRFEVGCVVEEVVVTAGEAMEGMGVISSDGEVELVVAAMVTVLGQSSLSRPLGRLGFLVGN